uniref:Uncharacterized protein n=1 Tax=Romanomermis culicivorax TaxID=13658 RepID=A0A915ITF0_ROMCU
MDHKNAYNGQEQIKDLTISPIIFRISPCLLVNALNEIIVKSKKDNNTTFATGANSQAQAPACGQQAQEDHFGILQIKNINSKTAKNFDKNLAITSFFGNSLRTRIVFYAYYDCSHFTDDDFLIILPSASQRVEDMND